MKLRLVIVTTLVILIVNAARAVAGDVSRERLDRLWEEHMLTATPADLSNGRPSGRLQETRGLEQARGSWVFAVHQPQGIRLSDYSGTRAMGLLRGGGWALYGGPLEQAKEDTGTVELYVKKVAPIHPGLLEHSQPIKEQSYEFFLLYRPNDAAHARILRKWVIAPKEVTWDVPEHVLRGPLANDTAHVRQNERSDVRGFLTYDPASKVATITITGLKQPWKNRVDVAAELAR